LLAEEERGKTKKIKQKYSTLQNWDENSQHIYPLEGRKNAWLDNVLFFLKQVGERKKLPAYNGKFRNPSVRLDQIHRRRVRIESRSCIESFTLWLVRVVDTATAPRQPKRRWWWWKNSTDRQIKRQKNAVSLFLVSVFRLSLYACLSTNKTCMQINRSAKERNLLICGACELMELRISVTTTTAIKFGLQHSSRDRLKNVQSVEQSIPPQRGAQGPTLRGIQVPFWNANVFFFRSHFRCLLGYIVNCVFWASGVIWDANIFYMTCTIVFFTMVKILHFVKIEPGGLIKQPHWTSSMLFELN